MPSLNIIMFQLQICKKSFFGIGLMCHHTKSFSPTNFFPGLVSKYCSNCTYNTPQNDDSVIIVSPFAIEGQPLSL